MLHRLEFLLHLLQVVAHQLIDQVAEALMVEAEEVFSIVVSLINYKNRADKSFALFFAYNATHQSKTIQNSILKNDEYYLTFFDNIILV